MGQPKSVSAWKGLKIQFTLFNANNKYTFFRKFLASDYLGDSYRSHNPDGPILININSNFVCNDINTD